MTLLMTKSQISKLKIMSGLFRAAISFNSGRTSTSSKLPSAESDALFVEAIKMIDYDGRMYEHESLKGFRWYMMMQFPLPAYVCLLSGLRERTTGELCEQAWNAICEHHERRKIMGHLRTPLHVAFAPLFVKAWDAREAAETQLGRTIAPPKLITLLRQRIASMPKRVKRSPAPDQGTSSIPIPTEDYTTPAPVPPPQSLSSPEMPAHMPLYPNADPFTGMSGVGVSRQFPTAFPELHFGGEMDWNYLFQEYSGFMTPPPQQQYACTSSSAHDPSQQVSGLW